MHRLVKGGAVLATVHQDGLGPEHLGHFGKDGGAALGHDPVGEYTQQRVGRNAAETVGAAAFEAHAEFAHRNFRALVPGTDGVDFPEALHTVLDLVVHLLADKHLHAALIHGTDQLTEGVQLVVLAAQAHHQHAAGVGMMDHVGEDLAGILVVVTELGAAVIVREAHDSIHR